ncbi:MAG TPA: hypothetical protein IAA21_06490 [Candidatus Blautia faecigallinarum]|uniref:Phage-Barnase-EndoU-ColicinE5/D-RelE like nuclease 4 domain-containing protein n=1 Tax=Candidatus Blautia faecigallinarum TaxID=2838488 RepID=A0A9D2DSS1_9FIRM|nr:hypothetical protein [Candidatus Blautia faecigallinarum]
MQGLVFFRKEGRHICISPEDILYQAASVWNEMTEYKYKITYGYKKKLYHINLSFSPEDFPHLAGFQYLKDLSLPRLEALVRLKRTLDSDFMLFSFFPYMYPFYTQIKADFLISSHTDIVSFLFIIQPQPNRNVASDNDYLCCSAFKQEIHNYEINQRPRAILKKERFHLPFNTSTVLIDKLTP